MKPAPTICRREAIADETTVATFGRLRYYLCVDSSIRSSLAQDKPLKKINWGVTSLSGGNWIPWIAKEAKIYEKHGLDVQLILLRGSGQTSAALLGGSIFASPVALPTVMLADLSGADLINVAHTVPGVQTKMLVKPEIKTSRRSSRQADCDLKPGFAGRFSFQIYSAQKRPGPHPGNHLAFHRHAAGTPSGVVLWLRGRHRGLVSL